jgi:hypothetical protein
MINSEIFERLSDSESRLICNMVLYPRSLRGTFLVPCGKSAFRSGVWRTGQTTRRTATCFFTMAKK